MNHHDFRAFVQDAQEHQLNLLDLKSKEYSTDENKLANFYRGAQRSGMTPAQVADAWQLKHDISIDMIVNGEVDYDEAMLQEKFTDSINYLYIKWALLLDAMRRNT